MFLSNTSEVTYKLNIEVKDIIYAIVVTFTAIFTKSLEDCLKMIAETVMTKAVELSLPECFCLLFSDDSGQIATVQASKKLIGRSWEGETALMRMIDDGRLVVVGDKLRLTDGLTIGDLDKYGITRRYLVDLKCIETITGKQLTTANLDYHLKK